MARMKTESSPKEPYSFSTCTPMIGPPRVTCSGASSWPTRAIQRFEAAR